MAENHDLLKCPVCHGHGEFLRSEVGEQLTSGELKSRLDTLLAEGIPPEASLELATAAVRDGESRDFQRDVHSWNPQLPMWRRSPKE
jgi:hypothetical protein